MNQRLLAILSHIKDGIGVIDVGTDHAYLPVSLAKRNYPGNLFASDIREGPLQAAKRTAEEADVTDRIQFQLCDGLDLCDPNKVDTVVVAGMGGDTICEILDKAEWTMDPAYTLILQPMTKAEVLRYWLSNNDYGIVEEDLVEDGGTIYQILVIRFGSSEKLTNAELYTGAFSQVKDLPLFPEYLSRTISRFERAIAGMEAAPTIANPGRYRILQDILTQLKEMKSLADRS